MAETAPPRPGARRSLVPGIRLPRAVRAQVAIAAPVLFAVWALAGFYGSLGPALAATVLHSSSVVYGGLSLFILAGVASASALVLKLGGGLLRRHRHRHRHRRRRLRSAL
jgi:hypothetical protein